MPAPGGLSPKAVDKSVNQVSSSALSPVGKRILPALPKNEAHRFEAIKIKQLEKHQSIAPAAS
jgi:hypothetical protein